MYYKLILMFLLVSFIVNDSCSAQEITNVSGTIANESEISVSGVLLGNGPNVILFDNFEGGSNGNAIQTGSGSATYGEWNATSGTVTYSNASSVSGSFAFRADMSSFWLNYVEVLVPDTTMDIFVSHWLYLPSGDNFPGEGNSSGINWKQMWIQGTGSEDDDQVIPSLSPTSWILFGNNTPYILYPSIPYMTKGNWKHFKCWIKGGYSNDGEVKMWHLGHTGDLDLVVDDSNVSTMYQGGKRERVRVNGYGRVTSSCHPMFDDVYVAVGANAQARIEFGDDSTYLNCTNTSICVPTSWSSTSIRALIYQGSFETGDNVWIFVIDENGNVSNGFPVEIGASYSVNMPSQPEKVNVVAY